MIESIPELLNSFDEPFADYSAIPTFLVSQLAARYVKVVLTGDGGDEVFAGYPTHVAYRVSRLFTMIPRWFRERLINPLVMALPTSMERISFDYKAKRFVSGADLPLEQGHYWWKVIFNEEDKKDLCKPDWLQMGMRDSFEVFDRYFRKTEHADPLNRLLYVDAKTFLLDDNLAKVDRMTMANSLEARVPLLDHELVERVAMDTSAGQIQRAPDKTALAKSCAESLAAQDSQGEEEGIHSAPALLDQARTQGIPWRILRPGETESYRHVKRQTIAASCSTSTSRGERTTTGRSGRSWDSSVGWKNTGADLRNIASE